MKCCSKTIVRKHSDLEEIMKHLNKYFTSYHQTYKRTQSFGRMFFQYGLPDIFDVDRRKCVEVMNGR